MIIAIWVITAILLGLWSLGAWGLHAVATLGSGWAGDLRPLIDQIPYADVIEAWVPGWQRLLHLMLDLAQIGLDWLGGAAPLVVWVVWGAGALVLAAVAGVLTLVVALLRRSLPGPPTPPAAPPPTAAA